MVLTCISILTNYTKHVFMYLFFIYVSLMKYCFKSSACFIIEFLFVIIEVLKIDLFIGGYNDTFKVYTMISFYIRTRTHITYTEEVITATRIMNIFIIPKSFLLPLCNSFFSAASPFWVWSRSVEFCILWNWNSTIKTQFFIPPHP